MSGVVVASTAWAREAQGLVLMRWMAPSGPRRRAPRPSDQKRSQVKGWFMMPRTGIPRSTRPISVPQSGEPVMKARVPSIGSINHW